MKSRISIHLAVMILVVVAGSSLVSACFPLVAAGAAAGAMATFDRRSFGAQTEDQAIELKASSRFPEAVARTGRVSVTSFNRKVLLTGQVSEESAKAEVETAVAGMPNVSSVHNEIQIGPRANLNTTASDTAITTRVRASLLEARDLQSNAFKVVTESGTVYVMGLVTRREGDRAAQVVSRVGGVNRVITVYEYMTEDELARIERRPAR